MSKDFEPYAHKGMLELVGDLEDECLVTAEYKDFFVKLKNYIDSCFKPTSSGLLDFQAEMSMKPKQLSRAMTALSVTEGTSVSFFIRH